MEREKRRDEKTESRRRRTTTKRWSTTVYVRDRVAEKCGKRSEEERERERKKVERIKLCLDRKSFLSVSNKVGEQDTRLNLRDKAVGVKGAWLVTCHR